MSHSIYMNCDFCGSDRTIPIITRKDGYKVVRCKCCGLAYVNPRPTSAQLQRMYSKQYYEGGGVSPYNKYIESELMSFQKSSSVWNQRLNRIETFLPSERVDQTIRILDVGCAAGFFLKLAQQRNWQPYGVDISDYASDFARSELGLKVITGSFSDVQIEQSFFDVITMWDFLEHVTSPMAALRKAKDLLKSDAVLAISTPNLRKFELYGRCWYGFRASFEHLYYFTPQVLSNMLEQLGFKILEANTTDRAGPISRKLAGVLYKGNLLSQSLRKLKGLYFFLKKIISFFPERLGYGHLLSIYARNE